MDDGRGIRTRPPTGRASRLCHDGGRCHRRECRCRSARLRRVRARLRGAADRPLRLTAATPFPDRHRRRPRPGGEAGGAHARRGNRLPRPLLPADPAARPRGARAPPRSAAARPRVGRRRPAAATAVDGGARAPSDPRHGGPPSRRPRPRPATDGLGGPRPARPRPAGRRPQAPTLLAPRPHGPAGRVADGHPRAPHRSSPAPAEHRRQEVSTLLRFNEWSGR